MDNIIIRKRNLWLQELIIFCAMFILTMLHEWIFINSLERFLKGFIFFLILYIQAQIHRFYIFRFYLLRRYVVYAAYSLAVAFLGASILYIADVFWIQPEYFDSQDILLNFLYHFVLCIISTVTIMALSLMQSYALEIKRRNMDQILLNEMSLKFLHAQLNPHFFFNMLNNLYGVSLTEPNRTPELIVKLSELMRYQIENANIAKVSLADEINFIGNYVDLERERIGKRCDIHFVCSQSTEHMKDFRISPLLLIILVENSFKHSQNTLNWFVHIDITLSNDQLIISIENSLADDNLKKSSTKVGLQNLKQRLHYIYNSNFSFYELETELAYKTTLVLPLEIK